MQVINRKRIHDHILCTGSFAKQKNIFGKEAFHYLYKYQLTDSTYGYDN